MDLMSEQQRPAFLSQTSRTMVASRTFCGVWQKVHDHCCVHTCLHHLPWPRDWSAQGLREQSIIPKKAIVNAEGVVNVELQPLQLRHGPTPTRSNFLNFKWSNM